MIDGEPIVINRDVLFTRALSVDHQVHHLQLRMAWGLKVFVGTHSILNFPFLDLISSDYLYKLFNLSI